jgi:MscS family membrane protein
MRFGSLVNTSGPKAVDEAVEGAATLIDRVVDQLPAELTETTILGVAPWQWIGIAALAVVVLFLAWLLTSAGLFVAVRIVGRRQGRLDDETRRAIRGPVRLLLASVLFTVTLPALRLPDGPRGRLEHVVLFIGLFALVWLGFRIIDQTVRVMMQRFSVSGAARMRALVPLGGTLVKAVVVALAIVVLLENLGYNVAGILAGLGIGGLAFALAAQKTIENLFGGVSVIADEPVRVGDFCRFGDKIGTVEEIGLRSTRIRTLDRTLLSVPNAEFSMIQIENFGRRDMIRFYTILNLRYETTADQLRYVLSQIRRLLVSHARVTPDPARVRFVGFGAHSLDIEIFAYVTSTEWSEFLGIREDLLLRIMDIVGEAGASFAFPSQTLYLGRDQQPPPETVEQAERQVQEWRSQGRLPFPDYAPETLEEMDDTIPFPPEGSAVVPRSSDDGG